MSEETKEENYSAYILFYNKNGMYVPVKWNNKITNLGGAKSSGDYIEKRGEYSFRDEDSIDTAVRELFEELFHWETNDKYFYNPDDRQKFYSARDLINIGRKKLEFNFLKRSVEPIHDKPHTIYVYFMPTDCLDKLLNHLKYDKQIDRYINTSVYRSFPKITDELLNERQGHTVGIEIKWINFKNFRQLYREMDKNIEIYDKYFIQDLLYLSTRTRINLTGLTVKDMQSINIKKAKQEAEQEAKQNELERWKNIPVPKTVRSVFEPLPSRSRKLDMDNWMQMRMQPNRK